ncbi:MAG: hypothetical protein A2096_04725 [Spirochaetes bacterium GWF1_41_5]|nr:MAG: hypothetical protein A2096_04725 [Spirochaetes bacterium GWF1_41_5]
MDENLKDAVNGFNASAEKYNLAYEIARGDEKRIQSMLGGRDTNIYVLKIKMHDQEKDRYINSIVFINKLAMKVDNLVVIINTSSLLNKIDINGSWDEFLVTIYQQYSMSGRILEDIPVFNRILSEGITINNISYFLTSIENRDITALQNEISNSLLHIGNLRDMKVVLECEIINELDYRIKLKEIDALNIDGSENKPQKSEEKKNVSEPEQRRGTYLKGNLKLSPTRGYSIFSFRSGDSIYLDLDHSLEREKEILKKFGAYDAETGKASKIPGTILDIGAGKDNKYIYLVEIGPELFCRTDIEGNVRIDAPDMPRLLKEEADEKLRKGKMLKTMLFTVLGVIFVTAVLIGIILLR